MLEDVNVTDPLSPDPDEILEGEDPADVLPGSKTPPELLLKSLQDERQKRKELEDRITLLENSSVSPDVFSDEGKALQGEINTLKSELSDVRGELSKKDVLIAHPILKEKWEEFETFRTDPENKGMNLKTAAKAFLVEQGLFEPKRLGLEKPTGGQRTPVATGLSMEEIKILRETNFKKYSELLEKGLIKV